MRAFASFPKPLLATLATLFAAATILYSGLWMYYARWRPPVELGFDTDYLQAEHCQLVKSVYAGSPAERAGLKPRDLILEINGHRLESAYSLADLYAGYKPGDGVELTVKRPHIPAPLIIKGIFRARRALSSEGGFAQHLGEYIMNAFPLAFLIVGLGVLILRLDDANAWLLALMFASWIAGPDFANSFTVLGSYLRPFAMTYRAILNSFLAALFYFFFAVFPARSPLDRRAPWLRWTGLALGVCVAVPGLEVGGQRPPAILVGLVGELAAQIIRSSYNFGFIALGLLSLAQNAFSATTPEARRKVRVILWGTLVGVVPIVLLALASEDFLRLHFQAPLWLRVMLMLLLFLFPISFAYAVVKHRVLEIPMLLQRSARYLLVQRGFTILLTLVSVGVTLAFALSFARYLEPLTRAAVPGGIALGTGFGTLLLWAGTMVHKGVGGRIDRAFFRNSYDARVILEDLAERTRTATDRQELAALIEHHLNQALQPSCWAVYLETSDNQISAARGNVPPQLQTVSATLPTMAALARYGRPWEVAEESLGGTAGLDFLAPLKPDCLVPMLGRDSRLVGLLVLGPRLSEEPYSSEDKHLLASVASQAGVALESIRLGEKIAERIEAERSAAREMEFARQVQTRLFPQELPPMKTLEYTAACIPARQVGGDYYDFLELRPGRLGLVLADIAGKGVSGALLMANLQANLRSQYAMAVDDLPRLLASVNRLFYESTDEASYATLFFADYDDASRRLRYANCGHLPPLLLRASVSSPDHAREAPKVEWLRATCTVVGLFGVWQCEIEEVELAPGDTLVLYTDGITEAASAEGEEFGESRLLDILKSHSHLPVRALFQAVVGAVQQFSGGEQQDDITLVIARSRE